MGQQNFIESRIQTQAFLKSLLENTVDEALKDGPDPPDFYFNSNNSRKIAIEHTRLVKLTPAKKDSFPGNSFAKIDELIDLAHAQFNELFPETKLNIEFTFKHIHTDLSRKKKIRLLADKLCRLVQYIHAHFPINTYFSLTEDEVINLAYSSEKGAELPDYFKDLKLGEISIIQSPDADNTWHRNRIVLYGEIEKEDILTPLHKKQEIWEKNNKNWKSGFDEIWLLLVATGENWSNFSSFQPKDDIDYSVYGFDRIYIFGFPDGEIVELVNRSRNR